MSGADISGLMPDPSMPEDERWHLLASKLRDELAINLSPAFAGYNSHIPKPRDPLSNPVKRARKSIADAEEALGVKPQTKRCTKPVDGAAWWLSRTSSGAAVRDACRSGVHVGTTAGLAHGYVQANLVIVPEMYADAFREYCRCNPRPCPLLEELPPGQRITRVLARGTTGDIAMSVPRYIVWRDGEKAEEPKDLLDWWRDDLVGFLLGCSFSFEESLEAAGIPVRHNDEGRNVPMYVTSRQTEPAGPFRGPLVVSMRPLAPADVQRAIEITARFPRVHGAPVHVGDPAELGIADLSKPDFGDAVTINPGEVPCFWACGVTPQMALRQAKLPLAITHAPGHMFVCDVRNVELATGGRGGGRRGLLPLLVLGGALLAVAVAMTVEEWRATQGPVAAPAAADNVAGQSFVTRALARLLEVRLSLGTASA